MFNDLIKYKTQNDSYVSVFGNYTIIDLNGLDRCCDDCNASFCSSRLILNVECNDCEYKKKLDLSLVGEIDIWMVGGIDIWMD